MTVEAYMSITYLRPILYEIGVKWKDNDGNYKYKYFIITNFEGIDKAIKQFTFEFGSAEIKYVDYYDNSVIFEIKA